MKRGPTFLTGKFCIVLGMAGTKRQIRDTGVWSHTRCTARVGLYPCRSAKLGVTDSTYFEVYGDQMNSVSTRHFARSHQSVLTGS